MIIEQAKSLLATPSKLLERFKTLLKRAGLPHVRFHDLRHSAASILLSLGIYPKVVQELLGHNQVSMMMDIYSHVLPTMHIEAINKLNDAFQGKEKEPQVEDESEEEDKEE